MNALESRGSIRMDQVTARWLGDDADTGTLALSEQGCGAAVPSRDETERLWKTPLGAGDTDSAGGDEGTETPVIDEEAWTEFVELMRDEDDFSGVTDTVAEFLDDTGAHMEILNRAFLAGDSAAMKKAAHHLKSACGNLGAGELARLLAELEAAASAITEPATADLVLHAEQVWGRTKAAFNTRCVALGGSGDTAA